MTLDKREIWKQFCKRYRVVEERVTLFMVEGERAKTFFSGRPNRLYLRRSEEMEKKVIDQVSRVIDDYRSEGNHYEGPIYMMYRVENGEVIPLYIGKSQKCGRRGGNLSPNIKDIRGNKGNSVAGATATATT